MSIRKHIPNSITCLNLLCGVVGMIALLKFNNMQMAFCFMIGGAVFDFFDGFSARLLDAYSPVGKELDSLADDITFGALPATMLFCSLSPEQAGIFRWLPLLIAAFSALRLAKFNLDSRQSTSFIGLPTPTCAMVCGSLGCLADSGCCPGVFDSPWLICPISVCLCFLLVCEVPMFSMKIHKGEKLGKARIIFLIVSIVGIIVSLAMHWHWSSILLTSFTSYIIINLVARNGRRA